jgi:hypothetical protein
MPYALCVEVQCALRIPLAWLVINPSNIIVQHAFLFFHSWCLSFLPWGSENHQEICTYLCWYVAGDLKTLQEEHTIKTQRYICRTFNLHQFGVAMVGRCETMVHGVKAMLNLHPEWVVLQMDIQNMFYLVSPTTIF